LTTASLLAGEGAALIMRVTLAVITSTFWTRNDHGRSGAWTGDSGGS